MKLIAGYLKHGWQDVAATRILLALAALPVFALAIFVGTVISAILFGGSPEP